MAKKLFSIFIVFLILIIGIGILNSFNSNLNSAVFLDIECGDQGLLPGCDNIGSRFNLGGTDTLDREKIQNEIVPEFINWIIGLIAGIAVIVVMIGGFKWVLSMGDNVQEAGKTVAYGIIGLVVAILSFAIIQVVNNIPTFTSYNFSPYIAHAAADESTIEDVLETLLPESPIDGNENSKDTVIENSSLSSDVIPWIIDILLRVVSTVAFVVGIYGAYNIATAGGDSEKIKKGANMIVFVVLGMVIVSLAYLIIWGVTQIDFSV